MRPAREQRLVFGEVAATYDRVRPGYPDALVDAVFAYGALAEGDRALEIGAGTGRATALFAARGLRVTALEPSAEMAAVAQAQLAAYPDVTVVETLFEDHVPAGDATLVFAAQALHWVPPEVRYQRIHAALAPGGCLAAFWNVPMAYRPAALRPALDDVYERLAPDVPTRGPGSGWTTVAADQKVTFGEMGSSGLFGAFEAATFDHDRPFTTGDFVALLETQSDHRLLAPEVREPLLAAIAGVIDDAGGTVTLEYRAHLYLARASS